MKYNLVDSNVLQRVFHLRVFKNTGTGFVVEVRGNKFLVTAKHLFEDLGYPKTTLIGVGKEGTWAKVDNQIFYHSDDKVDIAVIKTSYFDKMCFGQVEYSDKGMFYGQDVFMLGFPYGLKSEFYDLNRGYPLPYVKKGIWAGKYGKYFAFDWDNNHGFSGGPVVFREYTDEQFSDTMHIAGVICSYIPHKIKVFDEQENIIGYTKENSGMGIVCPIHIVNEVIDAIPFER